MKIKILLVDDQADNILVLESLLGREEYDLVAASSGKEALRRLLEQDFAVILLDVRMPVMDGYETAAMIRKRERSVHTPIIFITAGRADEEQLVRGYALGAVDYIHKPIVPQVLQAKVAVFAELHRKTLNLAASEEALRREFADHKKAEEARLEAERLRERDAVQKRFVATVSHELRTPIAAIKASAESLRRAGDADPESRPRYIKIIEGQSERLASLVDDLLVLSELESGKIRPEPRRIPLLGFLKESVESVAPLAARRKVELSARVEKPIEVFADRGHLGRVVSNLLDNAIKYNKKGGSVSVTGRAAGAREAQVTISDTGAGILPEDLPNIFQPFYRTRKAREAAVKGTGLGLHIIKTLVESNGGRIWVENGSNAGCVFHFTVPLADGRSGGRPPAEA